jgi:transketolase
MIHHTEKLSKEHLSLLKAISKSCRRTIIEMLKISQSGHPGGSLSSIDYLALLYSFILSQTGEKIVISNGHISPAVYAILAELDYINKEDVIKSFRKIDSPYEGHVARHVPGIFFGTGPLGVGVSAACGFALAEKLKMSGQKVFCLMGDGEAQEGQVYEMINFSAKHKLDNLILFIDFNKVQLTASLEEIIPLNLKAIFKNAGWQVIELNGHNYQQIWHALRKSYQTKGKPIVLIGKTIMGKGVDFMEKDGRSLKSNWHGSAPSPQQADQALKSLQLSKNETDLINRFKRNIKWHPRKPEFPASLSPIKINCGKPTVYKQDILTDCRSAYGMALLDLAKLNPHVLALTADLRSSVMTKYVANELPSQHIECGIAEQHMVSLSGGLSLDGFIPFCSTFGVFMSSRAKDQARVNDINQTNVKMVATHCGLSVGEDGPTHQAIDDSGSFLGLFNTMTIEPADPNQTDRIIRYIASHYGNFYVRMGRHKIPIIMREDGTPLYDENYVYEYGRSDVIRQGKDITIAATGAMVNEALKARELLKAKAPKLSVEIVAVTSIKKFDKTLIDSIKKTGKLITVEDHNTLSGLGGQLGKFLASNGICLKHFRMMGVEEYQLSGKVDQLYKQAGIGPEAITEACEKFV